MSRRTTRRTIFDARRTGWHSEVGTLMLTHKDRLLRFGADLVFGVCRFYGVRVMVLENGPETLASPGRSSSS